MGLTWLSIFLAAGAIALVLALGGAAAVYLYRHRPEPDDKQYFWDERSK